MPPAVFPILLGTHVAPAVGLFLPSILLPFTLRTRRATADSRSSVVRALLRLQSHGTMINGAGLALTGLGLLVVLGQPWLVAALAMYALDLGVAFFVQRPSLRRLVGIRAERDDPVSAARARRQRYVSYAMAGLVGTIALLMSTKPQPW